MILTPSFDQEFCRSFGLGSDAGHLLDLIIKLPTWAQKTDTDDGVFYFLDYGKLMLELPVIFKSKSKITKLIKPLLNMTFVETIRVGRSNYFRASEDLKNYWKKTKSDPLKNGEINRSKNRTFYKWNDTILKIERIVLKIEPISTPAISTPLISTPIESEINRSKNRTAKATNKEPKSKAVWLAYANSYSARYACEPLRSAKVNKLLCNLVDEVGSDDAPEIAKYYLSLSDQWYLTKFHDVATLVQNSQAIRTQWLNQTKLTRVEHRQTEQTSARLNTHNEVERAIQAGEI